MATQQEQVSVRQTASDLERTKVFQLMQINVLTCMRDDTLAQAAELMWNGDCGSIPVVDAWHEVVGIITDRDVCMAAYTQGIRLSESRVFTAMAHQVWTCSADDTLADALRVMREHHIRRLPVVDANRHLLGLLSLSDICCYVQNRAASVGGNTEQGQVASTIAAICKPRRPAAFISDVH